MNKLLIIILLFIIGLAIWYKNYKADNNSNRLCVQKQTQEESESNEKAQQEQCHSKGRTILADRANK